MVSVDTHRFAQEPLAICRTLAVLMKLDHLACRAGWTYLQGNESYQIWHNVRGAFDPGDAARGSILNGETCHERSTINRARHGRRRLRDGGGSQGHRLHFDLGAIARLEQK